MYRSDRPLLLFQCVTSASLTGWTIEPHQRRHRDNALRALLQQLTYGSTAESDPREATRETVRRDRIGQARGAGNIDAVEFGQYLGSFIERG